MLNSNDENSSTTGDHHSSCLSLAESANEKPDEAQEIRRLAQNETRRIRYWRLVVALSLLATSLSVILTTFFSLSRGGSNKYKRAFSLTIAESVQHRHTSIQYAYKSASDVISSAAIAENATWPFYTFPRFEQLAFNARHQSKTEVMVTVHLVGDQNRQEWLRYSSETYEYWTEEGHSIQRRREGNAVYENFQRVGYQPFVVETSTNGTFVPSERKDHHWVAWSYSPPPFTYKFINYDFTSVPDYDDIIMAVVQLKNETLLTRVRRYASADIALTEERHASMHSGQLAHAANDLPHSIVFHPLHKHPGDPESEVVAVVVGGVAWDAALINLLPNEAKGIVVVITNNCGQAFSFEISGPDVMYLGAGDLHDQTYNTMVATFEVSKYGTPGYEKVTGHCVYMMHAYPSRLFEETWNSNSAGYTAAILGITFLAIILVFVIYDVLVQRRNEKLIENAARTRAVVSSLFPSNVRAKLIGGDSGKRGNIIKTTDGAISSVAQSDAPIADLFLETTIMFADIAGFTAWSSVREPSHVFTFLETVFAAFDSIAKARRVFKVETVGDCYVAATGIPVQNKDHAVAMCRFARDILRKMSLTTRELEVTLGPETTELDLRIGIHSGSVTAGVLRGDKARFQLFGDTMNTTARIESSGERGKIHLSAETADILMKCGRGHWLQKREDLVQAKGKGVLQTYWLVMTTEKHEAGSCHTSETSDSHMCDQETPMTDVEAEKIQRLVDWNSECLLRIMKQIVALRQSSNKSATKASEKEVRRFEQQTIISGVSFMDEVKEIIALPDYCKQKSSGWKQPTDTDISAAITTQLKDYVRCIASMYRSNPFHNFEHASHVTMSVLKLLSRIVAPTDYGESGSDESSEEEGALLHDHTYGITSDPLTHFACAFSALIHDVDHSGAPNAQLVKEGAMVASVYQGRSVAEQNSLALAWDLLMDERFEGLRRTIYGDVQELQRFRQLVVNAVMATDIVDKDLKALRNNRWERAFSQNQEQMALLAQRKDAVNRKATIVIEHLIQASDVAHTMQHWHVYRKWNERFFRECYLAYLHGRADRNPAETWYEGEIGFFDFYIIPLAKKLKDCGVFGISCDEYLTYALKNRAEWDARGKEIVGEMLEAAGHDYGK